VSTSNPTRLDVRLLLREAERYLAAVDTFRAEGCGPSWQSESGPAGAVGPGNRPFISVQDGRSRV
jgi:hypothetical protein